MRGKIIPATRWRSLLLMIYIRFFGVFSIYDGLHRVLGILEEFNNKLFINIIYIQFYLFFFHIKIIFFTYIIYINYNKLFINIIYIKLILLG